MSGPLSSNEIEDVVSSVRRLVSVDARPRPVTRDLAEDRLVLTPAFRVVPEAATAPLLLTTPLANDIATPGPADPTPVLAAEADPVAPPTFEAEWEEELWAEPDPPLSEIALAAEEAEVVAEAVPGPAAPLEQEAAFADVADEWLAGDASPSAAVAPAQHNVTGAEGAQAVKPDVRASVLELSAADMLTDGDGNPLTVLDEAALQQIIRQLIHEELKGPLGERITQNVRKLVRAEINRALAAHALD